MGGGSYRYETTEKARLRKRRWRQQRRALAANQLAVVGGTVITPWRLDEFGILTRHAYGKERKMETFGMRLGKASQYVQDAVIKSVHENVEGLINTFMQSGMASMFRQQALAKVHDPQGRALTLKIVTDALAAEEKAKAEEAAKADTAAKLDASKT